jgi:hypothetical protein
MNLEKYRVHKKLTLETPIICKVEIINPSSGKYAAKTIEVDAELTNTSGLAHDMTIIFSGLVTIGKEKVVKHVNEKSIIEFKSKPKETIEEIDNCPDGGCGIVIHV